MLKDAEDTFVEEEIIDEESSELYCTACGRLVTRPIGASRLTAHITTHSLTRSVFYLGS